MLKSDFYHVFNAKNFRIYSKQKTQNPTTMEKADAIIIGGGPAGVITALTAKRTYPDKNIVLVRSVPKGVIPCGIPYIFHRLENVEQDILPDTGLEKSNIPILIKTVTGIDRNNKTVTFHDGTSMGYDRLILAVGSSPVIPPIPGLGLKNVFFVKKDLEYLKKMREQVYKSKKIAIIGGGFIGVEFAEELSHIKGLEISLIELLPHCLEAAFDEEFAIAAEAELTKRGIKLHTGVKVVRLEGNEKVERIVLSNGHVIDADMVIVSIGARPNTELAIKAGLTIGRGGGIWVDEYLRTNDPSIFAVGDCAEKRDFFTRRHTPVMLASTAVAEARIAGANLWGLKLIRENRGTIATFSTRIGDLALGAAGLTEVEARREGFEIVATVAEAPNRHPGVLPGAVKTKVKLIFSKHSGILLGGQVLGGEDAGEIINIIALAIQKQLTATELDTLQIATHPLLTSAPTVYQITTAAGKALSQISAI